MFKFQNIVLNKRLVVIYKHLINIININLVCTTNYKINELKYLFLLGLINKKYINYYFNLPLNNQRTHNKKPKIYNIKHQIKLYNCMLIFCGFNTRKLSKYFLLFDYVNRLWFKQWPSEWFKIRKKRLFIRKFSYKKRTNINFLILKYKYIIRNFKEMHKKKQKFLKHFNLGFYLFEYLKELKVVNRLGKRIIKQKYTKYFMHKPTRKLSKIAKKTLDKSNGSIV